MPLDDPDGDVRHEPPEHLSPLGLSALAARIDRRYVQFRVGDDVEVQRGGPPRVRESRAGLSRCAGATNAAAAARDDCPPRLKVRGEHRPRVPRYERGSGHDLISPAQKSWKKADRRPRKTLPRTLVRVSRSPVAALHPRAHASRTRRTRHTSTDAASHVA